MNGNSRNETIPTRRMDKWIKLELDSSNQQIMIEPKDRRFAVEPKDRAMNRRL